MTILVVIVSIVAGSIVLGLGAYAWFWMHTWAEHQGEMTIANAIEILVKKARRE